MASPPDRIALNNTTEWVGDAEANAHQFHPGARYGIDDAAYGSLVLKRSP